MTVTETELIISQNLDSKITKIRNKETNLYKSVDQINNNLNFSLGGNDKALHILNNIKGRPQNDQRKERPQFITTVKTGVFLDPPHEIAILLGLSRDSKPNKSSLSSSNSISSSETIKASEKPLVMYSYSSRPKVLNRNYHANCLRSKRFTDGLSEIIRDDRRLVMDIAIHCPTKSSCARSTFGLFQLFKEPSRIRLDRFCHFHFYKCISNENEGSNCTWALMEERP
ncbi:hypothetical protein RUM43_011418 [Polyplax serrata]|uniref:Uncharacterized protein n=1 Tax=Polyplax serrata TaxID=468196 RepID=A0AAN8PF42_POLSC